MPWPESAVAMRYELDEDFGYFSLVHDTSGKGKNYYVHGDQVSLLQHTDSLIDGFFERLNRRSLVDVKFAFRGVDPGYSQFHRHVSIGMGLPLDA